MSANVEQAVSQALNETLKIDIGCGMNKKAGFIGVDQYAMEGVDIVTDLSARGRWLFGKAPESLTSKLDQEKVISDENIFLGRNSFRADSVDEAHCSHFLEHLTNFGGRWERVNFFNELYRILKPGATCSLIIPHWCSTRYYGDPTHKEPFSEMGFYYLKREWRLTQKNAPHTDSSINPAGYSCDFDATWAYGMGGEILVRNTEYQMYALKNYKEVATDIIATLTKPRQ